MSAEAETLDREAEAEAYPLADLTGFQRDLLVTIAGLDDPHGLAIKDVLESEYGGKEVFPGRLYPNLDTLSDKGLIEKGQRDRRTNTYTLSRRGRRELAAHRRWIGHADGDGEDGDGS